MPTWDFRHAVRGCQAVLPPGFEKMYLLPAPATTTRGKTYWLVGSYKDQTRLATAIREDRPLQKFLSARSVRLGLRDSDAPPTFIQRQQRYGTNRTGKHTGTDFTTQRLREDAASARAGTAPFQRIGDARQNVADFWNTQTPQSHHIVEFNHLEKIGVSQEKGPRDLDHAQLPCVLLAAEFHQRYISLILKETHLWSKKQLMTDLPDFYHRLYKQRSLLFWPLWSVSKIILGAAGVAVNIAG